MRSMSFRPNHHLPWAVVRCRSGNTMVVRTCHGITWASWINGWVGAMSMVTGCTQQGMSSPEQQRLMGMPSRLYVFSLGWPGTMKTSYCPDNCNPSTLWLVAYPNFAPATMYALQTWLGERALEH